ncbi:MAG: hypothetical protein K5790_05050 [Nitrosopumilus sp.]|uniref:hypothetical protein n=1 Tax=Nitrosopumilus sp. TaxID=2024843 RepID=UPI00247CC1B2|nr:hypothetical protein [Nitrosopumilus sp.]MCV0392647.1 hypothetical protein [Nitrosopumilus sp.]
MNSRNAVLPIILILGLIIIPPVFAEPSVSIIMEKTTYSYCEKLFYTIKVSEITGDPAIIHIRDESGKGSSAIPIPISDFENPIPSLIAFQEEIFPLGKYFIDVQYSGSETTAEFTLIDSNKICIPEVIKPILANWLSGNISDGFLMDAIQKYISTDIIVVPFEINESNVYDIEIPEWVKNVGYWWIEGDITDDDFSQAFNYLLERKIISSSSLFNNEI